MEVDTTVTIKLEKGKEIKLSLEEARELYSKLSDVCGKSPYYTYPIYPEPVYPINPTITFDTTTGANPDIYKTTCSNDKKLT